MQSLPPHFRPRGKRSKIEIAKAYVPTGKSFSKLWVFPLTRVLRALVAKQVHLIVKSHLSPFAGELTIHCNAHDNVLPGVLVDN